ncbi:MAG: hypothetical protein ACLQVD_05325 [Capsulimonadaceae bacterium]
MKLRLPLFGRHAPREYTVGFETKCYGGDWQALLTTGRLERMVARCRYNFDSVTLYINNVPDYAPVEAAARRLVDSGVVSTVVRVADEADVALAAAGITAQDLGPGYPYSIQELVGIHCCRTDYLLHFSGDSILLPGPPWIDAAIERLRADRRYLVANPTWNRRFDEARAESFDRDGDFHVGYGFSDQCYLISPGDFRAPIYGETHPAGDRYPAYGGESFEKRVDAFMRNHSRPRLTHARASYRHSNLALAGNNVRI